MHARAVRCALSSPTTIETCYNGGPSCARTHVPSDPRAMSKCVQPPSSDTSGAAGKPSPPACPAACRDPITHIFVHAINTSRTQNRGSWTDTRRSLTRPGEDTQHTQNTEARHTHPGRAVGNTRFPVGRDIGGRLHAEIGSIGLHVEEAQCRIGVLLQRHLLLSKRTHRNNGTTSGGDNQPTNHSCVSVSPSSGQAASQPASQPGTQNERPDNNKPVRTGSNHSAGWRAPCRLAAASR